jgi:uncharacterized lipoprotein YddW (UPF0748 family)
VQYGAYKTEGGTLSLGDWRRASLNSFVAGLYLAVKSEKPRAVFSISPGGNVRRNYNELYVDTACWVTTPGYVDMIIPQLYFGFENQTMPFESVAKEWRDMVTLPTVDLTFGLAVYKSGVSDTNAASGALEWINNSDIISRQAVFTKKLDSRIGLALYSYSYVLGSKKTTAAAAELAKLYDSVGW